MPIKKRTRVVADAEVNVEPEASELLFEAEDVAELLAEVTGEVVDVTADSDQVVFSVGEGEDAQEFTAVPETDAEILESSRRNLRGKRTVSASRRPARQSSRRPVKASTRRPAKTIRKIPSSK